MAQVIRPLSTISPASLMVVNTVTSTALGVSTEYVIHRAASWAPVAMSIMLRSPQTGWVIFPRPSSVARVTIHSITTPPLLRIISASPRVGTSTASEDLLLTNLPTQLAPHITRGFSTQPTTPRSPLQEKAPGPAPATTQRLSSHSLARHPAERSTASEVIQI